ncbi:MULTISPECIES: hypothetical protein [Metabacillus]|uniref:Uncharacterized protein n=1 Tax=Metabacillus endolithicus TaxID=1535204 RepID=A0ABW5C3J5_9BACI|nr:hypothetical protein [Metabacillus endolithicus]UPG61996.1 hypothetical protein MVE64_15505 [Metabacillus endolithicus]
MTVMNPIKMKHLENDKSSIRIEEEGYYVINLKASATTSWKQENNESLMLRLYVNEKHHQDIVLFYGNQAFTYKRLLGKMEPGTYDVEWACESPRNSQAVAEIESFTLEKLHLSDRETLAIQYAPKLYGRAVYGQFDNLYTDTPLEMIYFFDEWEQGVVIEYHMVFSHEDEGTPAVLLMSKWGRLLDIEYMARVYLNDRQEVEYVEYQGAEHKVKTYKGSLTEGNQIILQTATCNGNFTDDITSCYHFSFIPSYEWKREQEAREVVMERFPYINHVMRWEAERQLKNSPLFYNRIPNVNQYIYIQSSVWGIKLGLPSVDILCRLKGEIGWYSSSLNHKKFGSFSAAYTGPYNHFGIAVLLPEGKSIKNIAEIKISLINETLPKVNVKDLKVLAYDDNGDVTKYIDLHFDEILDAVESEKVIWRSEN